MGEIEKDSRIRPEPPLEGDEASTLSGFLDYQRATFEWKCRGLTDVQLRQDLSPTSMTLAGLLKHLARVEDYWFEEVVAGAPVCEPWSGFDWENDPDSEWHSALQDSGEYLRQLWAERVEKSRQIVVAELGESGGGLGGSHPAWGGQGRVSLRWVLTHMVEEYARHNGHADLLRESIDGETGE